MRTITQLIATLAITMTTLGFAAAQDQGLSVASFVKSKDQYAVVTTDHNLAGSPQEALGREDFVLTRSWNTAEYRATLISCYDGHATQAGFLVSRIAGQFISAQLDQNLAVIVGNLQTNNFAGVQYLLREIYLQTEEHLRQISHGRDGGSTAVQILIVETAEKRFVVCANAGDSMGLMMNLTTEEHQIISADHSPENPDEYVSYVIRHNHRPDFARYHPFVYNRTPFPIWMPELDAAGAAVFDQISYQILLDRGIPLGGNQSVRKFVTKAGNLADGAVTGIMPGHEADNMGNTVNKGPQPTRTLGDFAAKPMITPEPSVRVLELDPTHAYSFAVFTDGPGDAWWFPQAGLPAWVTADRVISTPICTALINEQSVLQTVEIVRDQTIAVGNEKLGLNWDDLSFMLTHLPPTAAPAAPLDPAMEADDGVAAAAPEVDDDDDDDDDDDPTEAASTAYAAVVGKRVLPDEVRDAIALVALDSATDGADYEEIVAATQAALRAATRITASPTPPVMAAGGVAAAQAVVRPADDGERPAKRKSGEAGLKHDRQDGKRVHQAPQ